MIQEVVLARDIVIHLGTYIISWEEVLEALTTLRPTARTDPGARTIREVCRIKEARSRGLGTSIESLVFGFRHTQASNTCMQQDLFVSVSCQREHE